MHAHGVLMRIHPSSAHKFGHQVPLYFLMTSVGCLAAIFYVVEFVFGDNNDFRNIFLSGYFVLVTMTTVLARVRMAT